MASLGNSNLDWKIYESIVYARGNALCLASHSSMDGMSAKTSAID